MPEYVVSKVVWGLNEHGKPLNGSRVLVLGVSYKKNVDDMRESPSAEIMDLLARGGASIAYSDPHVPSFPPMRRYTFNLESQAITAAMIETYDVVVVSTNHDAFDYDLIRLNARLIVDARGVFREGAANVVRA